MESHTMNILSHPRSLAFGLVLLAATFGLGGSLACAQEIEPSSALPVLEADGNAELAVRPDALFCVTYYGADENCFSKAALVAAEETESSAVDEVAPAIAELAPSATETDSPSLYGADAIKVAITESVTIAAPESSAVVEVAPAVAELAPSATETDSPSLYGADAIKVAITESVTIAVPESSAVDEVAPAVAGLALSATETDSPSLYGADAIAAPESSAVDEVAPAVAELAPSATETEADTDKVAITESVTIAAPGQEVENSEPESTDSLPSDAATGEPNDAPDLAAPARDGTDC
jgi:hypothetical protein